MRAAVYRRAGGPGGRPGGGWGARGRGPGPPRAPPAAGPGRSLPRRTAALAAASPGQTLQAAAAAVCAMGLCGEIAYARLAPQEGNAAYRDKILDAVYRLTPAQLEEGARYELR